MAGMLHLFRGRTSAAVCTLLLATAALSAAAPPHHGQRSYTHGHTATMSATATSAPIPTGEDVCAGLVAEDGTRIRKEWRELSARQKENYINAIRAVVRTDNSTQVWAYHITEDVFVYAHQTNAFVHWHRMMLYQFENQLRALGGPFSCITLPYWDWTMDVAQNTDGYPEGLKVIDDWNGISGPSECFLDSFIGRYRYKNGTCVTRPFGLGWRTLGPCEYASMTVGTSDFQTYVDWNKDWHNQIHVFTGGQNGTMNDNLYSPWDPIFFLHHAFVDKMAATWQACHGYDQPLPNGPVDPRIYSQNNNSRAHDFDGQMATFPVFITPREVNNIDTLGYTYAPDTYDRTTYATTMQACRHPIPWVPRQPATPMHQSQPIFDDDLSDAAAIAPTATPIYPDQPMDHGHKAVQSYHKYLKLTKEPISALRQAESEECSELGPLTGPAAYSESLMRWRHHTGIPGYKQRCGEQ